ncbi:MAG TPA: hypothetical protein VML96_11850 [Egibacteraceae bacterium]|nr:hypothetical protein [Egibacteraceae bacterium]
MSEALIGIHGYAIGFTIMGAWALVAIWALVLRGLRRDETPWFWRVVSAAQILLVAQFAVGLALIALGRPSGGPGDGSTFDFVFHLLYGAGFPLAVLLFAHKWARDARFNPHSIFAVAGLVIFALALRGWQLGALG